MIGPWRKEEVLITARTYPTPAKKGIEVSCTGGITRDGRWIRLFPIPYRFLDYDKRFRKYQWIEIEVAKSSDYRPESHEVNVDSIRILSDPLPTAKAWAARKTILTPLQSHCLCCLEEQRHANRSPTLGFFKPHLIRRFIMRPDAPTWNEGDLTRLSQYPMFANAPKTPLEKIPYKFLYHIFCDHPTCRGHHLSCTDWEMGTAYRVWRRNYGDKWLSAFKNRFDHEMLHKYDTHLLVGTVFTHPASWIIVGLFYPPKQGV